MHSKTPVFDVVSITENKSTSWTMSMSLRDWSLQVNNLLLKSLITSAYGVQEGLISGLPYWAETARFDIRAKVTDLDPKAAGEMSREQRRALMAALLEDRFHLKARNATKILPVYDLLVAKNGTRFKENKGEPRRPEVTKTEFNGTTTMSVFSSFLEEGVGRPVIDKTGLARMYDVHLRWAQDLTSNSESDALPPIFTALQEQLGLKLQSDIGTVATLVVEHIEHPSEN
jgi:uncharacterized protein (TIGR03435 family)